MQCLRVFYVPASLASSSNPVCMQIGYTENSLMYTGSTPLNYSVSNYVNIVPANNTSGSHVGICSPNAPSGAVNVINMEENTRSKTTDDLHAEKHDEDSQALKRKRRGSAWCSAVNCKNNRKQQPDLSFFKFPLDPVRSKKWVVASRRKDLLGRNPEYLYKNCKICGEHFESVMFLNDLRNRLHEHAVPTIFCASESSPITQSRKMPEKKVRSQCKRYPIRGSTVDQEPPPMVENVWIKSEIRDEAEDKFFNENTTKVKVEIDKEKYVDLFRQIKQSANDIHQQGSDPVSFPELVEGGKVFIKEERLSDEDRLSCPEDFLSVEVQVKDEIITDKFLDIESQHHPS